MNERIEEYLEEYHCLYHFGDLSSDAIEDPHYFMYREEVEGLIELVVRECSNHQDRFHWNCLRGWASSPNQTRNP